MKIMSHKILRPFIVKESVYGVRINILGYFPLPTCIIRLLVKNIYIHQSNC